MLSIRAEGLVLICGVSRLLFSKRDKNSCSDESFMKISGCSQPEKLGGRSCPTVVCSSTLSHRLAMNRPTGAPPPTVDIRLEICENWQSRVTATRVECSTPEVAES